MLCALIGTQEGICNVTHEFYGLILISKRIILIQFINEIIFLITWLWISLYKVNTVFFICNFWG